LPRVETPASQAATYALSRILKHGLGKGGIGTHLFLNGKIILEGVPMATFGTRLLRATCYCALVMISLGVLTEASRSESDLLAGLWSGGGTVIYASGDRERARCRAHYTPGDGAHVTVVATCATASGSVTQTARLRKSGAGHYTGTFFNEQFSVSGTIQVIVNGSNQLVRLISSSGSAVLTLTH
jgi:hypothetical protein